MVFIQFNDAERKDLGALDQFGYVFDWTLRSANRSFIVGSIHDGDIAGLIEFERRPEGLYNFIWLIEVALSYRGSSVAGELLAYVGKDSLQQGFEGFMLLEAKTKLYHYFQIRYGAKPALGRNLFFDEQATRTLIAEYLPEKEQK
ncbi:MAG: hypothetical protein FWG25_09125 [Promicromonosporaceae bacterium]|nr:hypothetical protein [Promicromonosporaceae bacterium]